ncbi:hypothetical protein LXD69_01930 [Flavobacterium sediminilitoris]|uniref:Lipoprotein n=2 Tax=Flavobacterium sediminilitoris TaxID=2024526 RepID=A0ABY4HN52_9FLAO|nr:MULTISPECIES: hypothetical protein [Flavobacterium]UOX34287.1 hypothetical protein LXD69_01930 [Flavobacterium sediminilitoris]
MKKIFLILILSFFVNCKRNTDFNNEDCVSLFETIFYSSNLKENIESVNLLNNKILKSEPYYYKIIISDSLKNGVDYDFKLLRDKQRTPDINQLSICYKTKDSILINNIIEKQANLDKYLNIINLNGDEIFTEFSIESSKSGKMNVAEWKNSINLLKVILKKITEKQIIKNEDKPFRMLFILKGDCYLQPGPPPR